MKFCPSCSFDLSSVMVKSKIETSKKQLKKPNTEPEPEPETPDETEQEDLIMKVAKNLVVKKDGSVKKKATDKQNNHLQKARETLEQKRAQKRAEKKQSTQEPKQEEEQQPAGYVPLFNIFN